jgi:spore coat polysaccharide biosynthesis protein SpsF
MKIGFVILCRYSSSRLPGKILMEIKGKPILDYIIERLLSVNSNLNVVIATSNEDSDHPIAQYCLTQEISYFRGSLENVAERFLQAAQAHDFDFVFRINGDNLFLDPDLIRLAIAHAETGQFDFISNVERRTFPKGMSIEGVDVSLYAKALRFFSTYEKEHVMPYFYSNASQFRTLFLYNNDIPEMAGVQLAIDTLDDFEIANYIIDRCSSLHIEYGMKEIFEILKTRNRDGKAI